MKYFCFVLCVLLSACHSNEGNSSSHLIPNDLNIPGKSDEMEINVVFSSPYSPPKCFEAQIGSQKFGRGLGYYFVKNKINQNLESLKSLGQLASNRNVVIPDDVREEYPKEYFKEFLDQVLSFKPDDRLRLLAAMSENDKMCFSRIQNFCLNKDNSQKNLCKWARVIFSGHLSIEKSKDKSLSIYEGLSKDPKLLKIILDNREQEIIRRKYL